MTDNLIFNLVKAAKSKGGDKYICESDSSFSIYVPQSIYRASDEKTPVKSFKMDLLPIVSNSSSNKCENVTSEFVDSSDEGNL